MHLKSTAFGALLGEQVAPYHLAGAALVFGGVALASRRPRAMASRS